MQGRDKSSMSSDNFEEEYNEVEKYKNLFGASCTLPHKPLP